MMTRHFGLFFAPIATALKVGSAAPTVGEWSYDISGSSTMYRFDVWPKGIEEGTIPGVMQYSHNQMKPSVDGHWTPIFSREEGVVPVVVMTHGLNGFATALSKWGAVLEESWRSSGNGQKMEFFPHNFYESHSLNPIGGRCAHSVIKHCVSFIQFFGNDVLPNLPSLAEGKRYEIHLMGPSLAGLILTASQLDIKRLVEEQDRADVSVKSIVSLDSPHDYIQYAIMFGGPSSHWRGSLVYFGDFMNTVADDLLANDELTQHALTALTQFANHGEGEVFFEVFKRLSSDANHQDIRRVAFATLPQNEIEDIKEPTNTEVFQVSGVNLASRHDAVIRSQAMLALPMSKDYDSNRLFTFRPLIKDNHLFTLDNDYNGSWQGVLWAPPLTVTSNPGDTPQKTDPGYHDACVAFAPSYVQYLFTGNSAYSPNAIVDETSVAYNRLQVISHPNYVRFNPYFAQQTMTRFYVDAVARMNPSTQHAEISALCNWLSNRDERLPREVFDVAFEAMKKSGRMSTIPVQEGTFVRRFKDDYIYGVSRDEPELHARETDDSVFHVTVGSERVGLRNVSTYMVEHDNGTSGFRVRPFRWSGFKSALAHRPRFLLRKLLLDILTCGSDDPQARAHSIEDAFSAIYNTAIARHDMSTHGTRDEYVADTTHTLKSLLKDFSDFSYL